MRQICSEQIIPGIINRDYDQFAEALYTFNRASGEYYSDFQSGSYHSRECAELVTQIRNFGVPAVGQSSWGPTLFAVAPELKVADDLARKLETGYSQNSRELSLEISVTRADNCGMKIENYDATAVTKNRGANTTTE